jgi:hypothetical protein
MSMSDNLTSAELEYPISAIEVIISLHFRNDVSLLRRSDLFAWAPSQPFARLPAVRDIRLFNNTVQKLALMKVL